MAITEENGGNGFYMPVAPAYNGNGGMFGGMGGDWFAWIILVLLIGGNGWGMGGFGMGGMMPWLMGGLGGMGGGFGLDYLYPWLNNSQHISDGFRDQQISSQLGDILLGQAGIQQAICQTGNGITGAVRDGFSAAEIAANGRQMANMQQNFSLQTQLADCCCKNQTGLADLKYTVATENCADRTAAQQNTQTILTAMNAGIQSIKDELCNDRLDAARRENDQLRSQLQFANLQASQVAQTAELRTAAQTANANLLTELRNCPIPTYSVYGNVPVYQCNGNGGCRFGCSAA